MADSKAIDRAIDQALAATAVHKRGGIPTIVDAGTKKKHRPWTAEESEWLRKNVRKMSHAEAGVILRRSAGAVKIHASRELHIDHLGLSKSDLTLTAEHVASGMGIDSKTVHNLMDRGLMPGGPMPSIAARKIRVVDRILYMRWLLDPMHWCYFDPARVGKMSRRGKRPFSDLYDHQFWTAAEKQVAAVMKKWKDRWLTPGQASRLMGVCVHNINAAINAGTLPAVKWGNWRILQSNMPKKGKFNAKGVLRDKLYGVGQDPASKERLRRWWKGVKKKKIRGRFVFFDKKTGVRITKRKP